MRVRKACHQLCAQSSACEWGCWKITVQGGASAESPSLAGVWTNSGFYSLLGRMVCVYGGKAGRQVLRGLPSVALTGLKCRPTCVQVVMYADRREEVCDETGGGTEDPYFALSLEHGTTQGRNHVRSGRIPMTHVMGTACFTHFYNTVTCANTSQSNETHAWRCVCIPSICVYLSVVV